MKPTAAAAPPTPTSTPTQNTPLRWMFFTEAELAQQLPRCNVRKLRTWRRLRVGPPWLLLGRETIYLRASVEKWMAANEGVVRKQRPRTRRQKSA